jgi:flagellar protein FliO/FliZ
MSRLRLNGLLLLLVFPLQLLAESADKTQTLTRVEPFSMVNMLNMIMGLAVVVALILGLAWVLKRYGRLPVNNQVEMKILGGLSLGTREKAVLVQVEGQRLLLGVAPGRVSTLHVMDQESPGFNQQLQQAMEKGS